jgi:hypothetical protein
MVTQPFVFGAGLELGPKRETAARAELEDEALEREQQSRMSRRDGEEARVDRVVFHRRKIEPEPDEKSRALLVVEPDRGTDRRVSRETSRQAAASSAEETVRPGACSERAVVRDDEDAAGDAAAAVGA